MKPNKATERAWAGGPLRVVGTGKGAPSTYACETCLRSTSGVYYARTGPEIGQRTVYTWLCGGCRDSVPTTAVRKVNEPQTEEQPQITFAA